MRLFGLVAVAAVFPLSVAVSAQHVVASAPVHTSASVSHISSASPAAAHSPSNVQAHSPTTSHAGGPGLHPIAKRTREKSTSRENDKNVPKSERSAKPKSSDLSSLIHRIKRDKCKHGSCAPTPAPSVSLISQNRLIDPMAPQAHFGCTVVPVTNPGIPCNVYAPCCP
jgi:hypothetical protein